MRKLFSLVGYITVEGLAAAEKGISDLEKKARKAIRPIDSLGKHAASMGKSMTTAFTAPLAIAGGAVVNFGAKFEKAMTNSLAIMGDMSTDMRDTMGEAARDVAKSSTFSAKQAADAYFFLASAGMDAAQSLEALPRVAKFAQAGNFNLATATDLLTDAQSALGLSSKNTAESMANMTRVSDVLVKANTIANASVEQFSQALTNRAGAALRMLGKEVEEGAAVLAVFADQGRKGEEAGTALDIVLRDLQKASINNRKAFDEAGISVFDASGEMNNMADIISDLENRFSTMSAEQRRAELMTLGFTDKSVAATTALIGTSEAIREYETSLRSAAGTTESVANKQLKSFSAQWEIVKNTLIDVAIELSETLLPIIQQSILPVVQGLVGQLSDLAKWFGSLPDSVKKTTLSLVGIVGVGGPLLILFGKLLSSITLVTTAIKTARLVVAAFNATMLANPFGIAVLGIAAVTGAIIGLRAEYKKLTTAHQKYSLQTTDQAKRKEFIAGVDEVIKKLEAQGDAIKTEAQLEKALGKEIGIYTTKAREMGYVIEGSISEKLKAINTIKLELMGVRDATGELVKYISKKEEETEATKENTAATKENIKVKEEWAEKLATQGKEGLDLIEAQRIAEIKRAESAGENAATISAINKFYENEKLKFEDEQIKATIDSVLATKKAAESKRNSELSFLTQVRIAYAEFTGDTLTAIELRRDAEIKAAEDSLSKEEDILEAKKLINERYQKERIKAIEEAQEAENSIRQAGLEMQNLLRSEELEAITTIVGQIVQLGQMETQNKLDRLNIETQKRKEVIMAGTMSEKQKAKAIEKIDEEADKKKAKIMQRQAKRDKAAAIFSAIINTAAAVAKTFANLGAPVGIILGAIIGALGIAQIAMIAAQPLPKLAEGGLVPQTPGGRKVIVGEGSDDETILPMRKGSDAIADRIMDKVGSIFLPENQDTMGVGSRRGKRSRDQKTIRPVQNVWHIGTLVADDEGIKELERRQFAFRVSEDQRKGGE